MLVERSCPRHGYGLGGDGCPVCHAEISLKRREVEAMEKANELEAKKQWNKES